MDRKKIGYAGIGSTTLFAILTVSSLGAGLKVAFIGWTAFFSMVIGGLAAKKMPQSTRAIIWTYGLSGGAALSSILFFVMPKAIMLSKNFGVTGIVAGFLSGLTLHSLSHQFGHTHDHDNKGMNTLWSVSLHAAAAGLVIGLIYQQMPAVSILLGVAIVSHKLPAGYMIANRLENNYMKMLLLPASAVGTVALLAFNYPVALTPEIEALFFGFSSGIFLHVALDFIPEPEPESHLRKLLTGEEDPLHHELDEIKADCVLSTIIGAAVVVFAALLI